MRMSFNVLKNTVTKGVLYTYGSVGINMMSFLLVQPLLFRFLSEDYVKFIYISFVQAFISVFEMPFATMLTADDLGNHEKTVYGLSLKVFVFFGALVFLIQIILHTQDIYFIILVSMAVIARANSNILRGINNSKLKFNLNFKIGLLGAILRNFIPLLFLILGCSFEIFWLVFTISFLIENVIYRSSSNLHLTAIFTNSRYHFNHLKKRMVSLGAIAVLGLVTTQVERYTLLNGVIESSKSIAALYYQYISAIIALLMPVGQLYLALTKNAITINHYRLVKILKIITILFLLAFMVIYLLNILHSILLILTIVFISIAFNVFWYYIVVKQSESMLSIIPFSLSIIVLLLSYTSELDLRQFLRILMLSGLFANLGYVVLAHLNSNGVDL